MSSGLFHNSFHGLRPLDRSISLGELFERRFSRRLPGLIPWNLKKGFVPVPIIFWLSKRLRHRSNGTNGVFGRVTTTLPTPSKNYRGRNETESFLHIGLERELGSKPSNTAREKGLGRLA